MTTIDHSSQINSFSQFRDYLKSMEIELIWFSKMNSESYVIPGQEAKNQRASISVASEYQNREDNKSWVKTTYKVEGVDGIGNKTISIELTINVLYNVSGPFTDELFNFFSAYTLPSHVLPYAREYIQSATVKMGLPPLILPIWKSPQLIGTRANKKSVNKKVAAPSKKSSRVKAERKV